MVADPSVDETVRLLQPACSVNTVAQAVGIAALNDETHVAEARKDVSEGQLREVLGVEQTRAGQSHHGSRDLIPCG